MKAFPIGSFPRGLDEAFETTLVIAPYQFEPIEQKQVGDAVRR